MNQEEILLNNVKYFSEDRMKREIEEISKKLKELENKSELKKEVVRFGKDEHKIMGKLDNLFDLSSESVNEEYAIEKGITILDPANVCGVTGKSERAKRLLAHFKCSETEDKPEPTLDYNQTGIAKSRLSMEYIVKIIETLCITSEWVEVTTGHDYPITLENKDFKFVLAPRISPDEE